MGGVHILQYERQGLESASLQILTVFSRMGTALGAEQGGGDVLCF